MKQTILATFIILSMSLAASATGFMLLKVGSADGNGVASGCTGAIDLSEGCPQPMLGL